MKNRAVLILITAIFITACGTGQQTVPGPDLEIIDQAQFRSLVTDRDRPTVVNIWASWCIPCRSEAPLLEEAHRKFTDRVSFVGIAVSDKQDDARAFISEFAITFDNYFDRPRAIPGSLGRVGVPITFFFAADGSLVAAHSGVIDERTLAVNIDELLTR